MCVPDLEGISRARQRLQIDAPELRVFLGVVGAVLAEPALGPGPPDRLQFPALALVSAVM